MVITTDDEYRTVLAEIEALMGAELGTPEGKRLDELVSAIEAWEAIHHRLED
jgi:HTH-type transcriptional regulator/antitoxin HigA